MSSSESLDSLDTYIVKRKPKRTASEIWRDSKPDDNISDGEYHSASSVEMMVDSDDEFSFFSVDKDDGVDLCVVGNQMPLGKAESNTDLDGFLPDRMFFQPKVVASTNEMKSGIVDARHSSNETERLVMEEIENMEREKQQQQNQLIKEEMENMEREKQQQENQLIKEEMEKMEREKKQKETLDTKQQHDEMKRGQDQATSIPKGITSAVETNKDNDKNASPKKQLFYGNMIRSTLDPPRAGTPTMFKKNPITDAQRKQLLTRFNKVNNNKLPEQHLKEIGSSSSHSLAESSSGHGSLPSSSVLLPATSSSSGHGSLPSSSILLPTMPSCGIESSESSVTSVQRERQTEALDIIEIGHQEIRPTNEVILMQRARRNPPISERRRHLRRQARAAFSEAKKPNLFKRIQTRLVRFEHFIRKHLTSLSCTRGSDVE